MMFFKFFIFSVFCLLQVRSDLITEFTKSLDEGITKILNYEENFADSVVLMLSNLRDASTETNSKALEATLDQAQIIDEKAKTKEQTDCIESARLQFNDKITQMAFDLDACVQGPKAIGDSVRQKLQAAHEKTLKLKEALEGVKNSCKIENPDDCISSKTEEMKTNLTNLLDEARLDNIAGETIKSKILSEALTCNAKLSSAMLKTATDYQDLFKKCV